MNRSLNRSMKRTFFAHNTVVKVVLKDVLDAGTSGDSHEFFIHKSLLSSLSPELDKHTNNDMKEGREGVLVLSEVDIPTMEAFTEWAYFKDYAMSVSHLAILELRSSCDVLIDTFNAQGSSGNIFKSVDPYQGLRACRPLQYYLSQKSRLLKNYCVVGDPQGSCRQCKYTSAN